MRSPREILLGRHQATRAKLDEVRRRALATAFDTAEPARAVEPGEDFPWLRALAQALWAELVWPCRRVWIGLAMVWLIIAVLHLAIDEAGVNRPARATRPGPQLANLLREQNQFRAQLLETRTLEPTAELPPDSIPKARRPRSQVASGVFAV
jgi:hypothetical protein